MILRFIGVDQNLVDTTVGGTGAPLWFLAAYTLVQSVVPLMARLHERAPRLTLLVLLAGVIAVDALRFSTGITEIGLLNLFFVWVLVHQLGFWYADGWFDRRRWWQLLLVAAACYAVLFAVCSAGFYSFDMLANLNPPTLPLVLLGFAQACLLRLLRPVLAAIMSTHWARGVVFLAGTRLMTIYLWHLPVIVILTGIALLIPGASPGPGQPGVVVVAHPGLRARAGGDLRAVVPRRPLGGAGGGDRASRRPGSSRSPRCCRSCRTSPCCSSSWTCRSRSSAACCSRRRCSSSGAGRSTVPTHAER